MNEAQPVYEIKNLTKVYKSGSSPANDNIGLEIREGEIFGIFGPNGAGKTTLVKQMAGLLKPTSGSILLKGVDVAQNPKIIPVYTAYFAQAPWILWSLKVWETIYFTGIFRGMAKKDAREQTEELMKDLDLYDIRDRLMERISGGQSKMLGIATTLIGNRPILILDEPTNDLDPLNRRKCWRLFSRLCREKGVTIVLVTHNVLEAEQVVDRVIIVDKGKIIAGGTPAELKEQVDDRVRIEINFKPGSALDPRRIIESATNGSEIREIMPGKWRIFIPKERVSSVYEQVMKKVNLSHLDDFRLTTTTLEDVYIRMGGRFGDFDAK